MAAMTITRTDGLTTEVDGTLSNAALRTLSLDDLRACYVAAQRGRKIAWQHGNAAAVIALDGYLQRITLIGVEAASGPRHQSPCVCGTYNRCAGVRADDARRSGNWRDAVRSYCD